MKRYAEASRIAAALILSASAATVFAQAAPAGTTKLYSNTSLTSCPVSETLNYFFYDIDQPGYRGSSWCGAAAANIAYANLYDTVRHQNRLKPNKYGYKQLRNI